MPRRKQPTPERKAIAVQNTQRWRQRLTTLNNARSQHTDVVAVAGPTLSSTQVLRRSPRLSNTAQLQPLADISVNRQHASGSEVVEAERSLSMITAVIRPSPDTLSTYSPAPRVEEDITHESDLNTEAGPLEDPYEDNENNNNWIIDEGDEYPESGADEEAKENSSWWSLEEGLGDSQSGVDEEGIERPEADVNMLDVDDDEASVHAQLQREISQSQDLEANTEEGADNVDYAVELVKHLHCFQGCDPGTHQQAHDTHFQDNTLINNHYSLTDITHITGRLPDVLYKSKIMKPDSPLRQDPPDWPLAFEGLRIDNENQEGDQEEDQEGDNRIHVCLYSSEQQHRPTQAQFDIDGIVGFANSLAFAKQGILLDLAPQYNNNIQTNLHLYYPATRHTEKGPKQVQALLNDITHYRLGKVFGQEDINIYAFFPADLKPSKTSNFPGRIGDRKHGFLEDWTNNILLPAIARHVPSDVGQHFPASWLSARQSAQARNREAQAQANKRASRHQNLLYPLQSQYLHNIWLEVEALAQRPENALYARVQLVFSSKNTKGAFKKHTLDQTWQEWDSMAAYALNPTYLNDDCLWVDLAKETICKDWTLPNQTLCNGASPATYLYRTCCLESFYQWSLLGENPKKTSKKLYTTAMLNNSVDMRIEMSRTSTRRQKGWVFSQFYNSYKETTDAAKVKPFHNKSLSKLGWDPKVAAMIEHQGKGSSATRKQLRDSYVDSKTRLGQSLRDSLQKSYSIREEHRVTLAFLKRMLQSLRETGVSQVPSLNKADLPYWELSSDSFLTFLTYNANKFLLAFEWILTLNHDAAISYEHCKVLAMLLQVIKHSYDTTPVQRYDGLWKDTWRQQQQESLTHGIGIGTTIRESGYGWFLPKIDWQTMTFLPSLTDSMKYSNLALRDTYRKRWAAVKDVKDDLKRLEAVGQWLSLYQGNDRIQAFLLEFITHLTTRYFRKEFFRSLKDEIRPEYQEAALAGEIMLCAHSLQKVFKPALNQDQGPEEQARLYIVSSNRTKVRTVEGIVNFLWDFDDGHTRKQWDGRGYRSLHRRALEIVKVQCGEAVASKLHTKTKRLFVLTTWILPYPSEQQFFQKTHGRRHWLSVYHRKWAYSVPAGTIISLEELKAERSNKRVKGRLDNTKHHKKHIRKVSILFMYKWALVTASEGRSMQAIPAPSAYWAHQADISMTRISNRLERMWEESEEQSGLDSPSQFGL